MFFFYQKVWSVIAVFFVGVTFAIAYVCISAPYTKWFGMSLAAIIFAELLVAGSWISVLGAKDRNLPFNISRIFPWGFYFFFTLLMPLLILAGTSFLFFILMHVIGFIAAGIFALMLMMCEHNISQQDQVTVSERVGKLQLKSETAELRDLILEKFAGDAEMRKVAEKISDLGAYAPNSINGSEDADDKLLDKMDALKKQLESGCNSSDVATAVTSLARAFARRNELIKELR